MNKQFFKFNFKKNYFIKKKQIKIPHLIKFKKINSKKYVSQKCMFLVTTINKIKTQITISKSQKPNYPHFEFKKFITFWKTKIFRFKNENVQH